MILNEAMNESSQTHLTHGRSVLKCILNHHNFIFNIYKNLAHINAVFLVYHYLFQHWMWYLPITYVSYTVYDISVQVI